MGFVVSEIAENGRLLRLPDVIERVGMGKTMIYRMIEQNKFPAQVRLNARSVAWREVDIQLWIKDRSPVTEVVQEPEVLHPVPEKPCSRALLTLVQKGAEA